MAKNNPLSRHPAAKHFGIASCFPRPNHQVIAYYLNHTAEVDSYLSSRQQEADSLRTDIEGRFDPRGMRARLMARRTAKAS